MTLSIFLNLFYSIYVRWTYNIIKNPNENINDNYVSYLFNLYNHGE